MTQILSATLDGIATAAKMLRDGGLVAIPTETVYGLAADARNPQAVARIYEAKGRPSFNPLIVHVPDLAAATRIALFSESAKRLASALWPGALTLVVPLHSNSSLSDLVTAGGNTVAIRVPAHPLTRDLLDRAGVALAAPSANRSGQISPSMATHVTDPNGGLGGRIDAVLDGGPCAVGVESTIIGWDRDQPVLLRPGGLDTARIEATLGRALLRPLISIDSQNNSLTQKAPNAPGQLTSHYAPRMALRMDVRDAQSHETFIAFGSDARADLNLSPRASLREAAAALFDTLRRADRLGRPIAVAPIPMRGWALPSMTACVVPAHHEANSITIFILSVESQPNAQTGMKSFKIT